METWIYTFLGGFGFPDWVPYIAWNTFKITLILTPLLLAVAYTTFAERKVIGYMQMRVGPNRVGPRGWLQPIADALKLLLKEAIIPTNANRFLFLVAPVLSITPRWPPGR